MASIRVNVIWMGVGTAVFVVCQWATLMFLARFGGPKLVGHFVLAVAIGGPVTICFQLGLRGILAADATGRHDFGSYLRVRLVGTVMAMTMVLVIAWSAGFSGQAMAIVLVVGLAKSIESVSDIYYGLVERHKRLDLVAKSMMVRGVLGLGALLALGSLLDPVVGLLGVAGCWALVLLVFDRRAAGRFLNRGRRPPMGPTWRDGARLAWLGLPVGLAVTLGVSNPSIPRYFVEGLLGNEALGTFGAMAYVIAIGRMTVHAMGQAVAPRLADHYALGDLTTLRRLLLKLGLVAVAVGGAGVLAAAAAGGELLTLLYGPEFASESEVFVWIMAVGLVSYVASSCGYALTAMQVFRIQPFILAVSVAANAAACFLLIPHHGLLGAALAWLLAMFVQFVLALAVVAWRITSRPADQGRPTSSPRRPPKASRNIRIARRS